MQALNSALLGAIAMASLTIGVFFLRYWTSTRDRFFLFFAASFILEGFNRFLLGNLADSSDDSTGHYLVRLLAYLLIVWAIVDKNLPRKSK